LTKIKNGIIDFLSTSTVKRAFLTGLAICAGIVLSFSLLLFWSGGLWVKVFILLATSLCALALYSGLTKLIHLKFETLKAELISLALVLIALMPPAAISTKYFISDLLILKPEVVELELTSPKGTSAELKILKVSLEGSSRSFSPTLVGDGCAFEQNILTTASGGTCKVRYSVPTHRNHQFSIELDVAKTNGHVELSTSKGSHEFNFQQSADVERIVTIPLQVNSMSGKIKYPVYLLAGIAIAGTFFLFLLVGLTALINKTNRIAKSGKNHEIFIYLLFFLLALIFANGRYGSGLKINIQLTSDAGNISSFVAGNENPENFKNDALLSNQFNYGEYFAFHIPLITFLGKVTGGYAIAFLTLFFPATFLHFVGYYLLGKRVFRNLTLAFLFSLAVAIPINLPLFEYYGISLDILPRTLFQVILPFALLLLLKIMGSPNRYWLAALVFTALLYVHPVSGPAWLGICLATLLISAIKASKRSVWLCWISAVFVSLLGLIPFLKAYLRPVYNQTIGFELLSRIQLFRYPNQLKPIRELYLKEVADVLLGNWVLISLILASIGALFVFFYNLRKYHRADKQSNPITLSMLISAWWLIILILAIVVPMLDEAIAHALGRQLILREIRRTLRYYIPMLWLTFFWICKLALDYFSKLENAERLGKLVYLTIFALLIFYGIETQIWKNPLLVRHWNCLKSGEAVCRPTSEALAMYEFYTELPKYVKPDESVFPDPDPQYLADTLIPRYHSLRSVVYTYKDGGAVGSFLTEWWRITLGLRPYLPTADKGLNPKVVELARTTNADYFYFIKPNEITKDFLETQTVVYSNEYGTLIRLRP